jgi:hypothetical protein
LYMTNTAFIVGLVTVPEMFVTLTHASTNTRSVDVKFALDPLLIFVEPTPEAVKVVVISPLPAVIAPGARSASVDDSTEVEFVVPDPTK